MLWPCRSSNVSVVHADCCADANAAVVVGNAEPDLLAWAQQQQQRQQQLAASEKQRLYVAKGHEARGVVEGLKQFGFL